MVTSQQLPAVVLLGEDKTRGVVAWVLEFQQSSARIECVIRSLGKIAIAYRSELSGMYALLAYTNTLMVVYGVQSGREAIDCDNKVALEKSAKKNRCIFPNVKHIDIICAIQYFRHELPPYITLTFVHIWGHQDNKVHFNDLTHVAQLHVQLGTMSKAFLSTKLENPEKIGYHYHGTQTRIRIGSSTAHMYICGFSPPIIQRLQELP